MLGVFPFFDTGVVEHVAVQSAEHGEGQEQLYLAVAGLKQVRETTVIVLQSFECSLSVRMRVFACVAVMAVLSGI